jgi:hypothetical protein
MVPSILGRRILINAKHSVPYGEAVGAAEEQTRISRTFFRACFAEYAPAAWTVAGGFGVCYRVASHLHRNARTWRVQSITQNSLQSVIVTGSSAFGVGQSGRVRTASWQQRQRGLRPLRDEAISFLKCAFAA